MRHRLWGIGLLLVGCGADAPRRAVDTGPPEPLTGERELRRPTLEVEGLTAPRATVTPTEVATGADDRAEEWVVDWELPTGPGIALAAGGSPASFVVTASAVAPGRVWRWEVARLDLEGAVLVEVAVPEALEAHDGPKQLQVVVRRELDGIREQRILAPRVLLSGGVVDGSPL